MPATYYPHTPAAHCLARRCPFSALRELDASDLADASHDGQPSGRQAGRFSDVRRAARVDGRIAEWVAGEIAAMERLAVEYLDCIS